MVLLDKHIAYLMLVSEGKVKIRWNQLRTSSKYVHSSWANGYREVDQTVAAQMHKLGATRINNFQEVVLTDRGESILLDEAEAWA